jgi:hypothetical protein
MFYGFDCDVGTDNILLSEDHTEAFKRLVDGQLIGIMKERWQVLALLLLSHCLPALNDYRFPDYPDNPGNVLEVCHNYWGLGL